MAETGRVRRLRWTCRRGMKELDVLLESFLAANEKALEAGQWPDFERLLDLEDDVLWDALREPGRSPEPDLADLIFAIRHASGRCA